MSLQGTLLKSAAVAALAITFGPLSKMAAWEGCADHCYGTRNGEDSGVHGCISAGGGGGTQWCVSYGEYCNDQQTSQMCIWFS